MEKNFKCEKSYERRSHLKRHFESVHLGQKITFDLCNKQFSCKDSLASHLKSKHQSKKNYFKCTQCDKQFTSISSLRMHIESVHDLSENGLIITCKECHKKFFYKQNFTTHVKNFHKGLEIEPEIVSKVDNQKSFPCKQCSNSYTKSYNLFRHIRESHINCTTCGKTFENKEVLSNHIQNTHTNVKKLMNVIYVRKCMIVYLDCIVTLLVFMKGKESNAMNVKRHLMQSLTWKDTSENFTEEKRNIPPNVKNVTNFLRKKCSNELSTKALLV